jgi:hypothetical protein
LIARRAGALAYEPVRASTRRAAVPFKALQRIAAEEAVALVEAVAAQATDGTESASEA